MEQEKKEKTSALIKVIEGGPLEIKGNFILNDLKRDITETPAEVYLCRCGKSSEMPFCDGSHKKF